MRTYATIDYADGRRVVLFVGGEPGWREFMRVTISPPAERRELLPAGGAGCRRCRIICRRTFWP